MEGRIFMMFMVAVGGILTAEGQEAEKEYPPYDGWYNNRAHPEWGVVDMPLTRRLPSHYQDGVYMPSGWERPNPRILSEELMKGVTGKNSYLNKTAFMVFFGQQVVEEILDAQRPGCPPEYFNIPIPKNDPLYDPDGTGTIEIPLIRSRYQQAQTGFSPNFPRQQLNEITSFIDGGLTYGVNKAWADALRLHNHCDGRTSDSNIYSSPESHDCRGELASSNDEGRLPIENTIGLPLANPPPPRGHELKSAKRFYRLGNPRGNENPFLLTFGVLWFRHHNYLAKMIREKHPDYSDEKVYNEARVLNIAIHQKIVFYEWLPIFLGGCPDTAPNCTVISEYSGYKSSIHPGITHAFQSAAMRFGHTLVPPGVFRRSRYDSTTGTCTFYNTTLRTAGESHSFQEAHLNRKGLRTCNTYWNSIEAISESLDGSKDGFSELVMGMASQICEREDNIITPDLRGSVFGPLEFSRRDLMAINIQRGRDHGLPDYNTAREYLGLGRRKTFEEVNPELFNDPDRDGPALLQKFIDVHDENLENIDIWTGGLLETTTNGPGELFREIILDQFVRIRDGDRFWFENRGNGLLSDADFEFVINTTIKDVILRTNPGMDEMDIQNMPFVWNEAEDPNALCPQPYPLNETDMEECTPPEHYDYFTGSEIPYALSWAAIGLYILLMLLLLFILGRRSMSKRQASQKRTDIHTSIDSDATVALEILGKADRQIQVVFGPGKVIQTKTTRGARLRTIPLQEKIRVMQSSNGRGHIYALYIDTETYDLILSFYEYHERAQFDTKLKEFTSREQIQLDEGMAMKEQQLMKMLRTKEARDTYLKNFFRDVTASLYDDSKTSAPSSQDIAKYANIEMSKHEFAANLNLKPNSLFVEQIFQIADKDSSGTISYREFMDVMWIFSKGDARSKAKLMFDMYDLDRSGTLTMEDFGLMLRSTMDMVNADVTDSDIGVLTQEIMQRHGFQHKAHLDFNDFQTVMSQYSDAIGASAFDEDDPAPRNTDTNQGAIPRSRETRLLKAKRTVREHVGRSIESSNGTYTAATDAAPPPPPERTPRRRNTVKIELHKQRKEPTTTFEKRSTAIEKYIRNYRMHIYWITLYTLVAWAIFAERVYYYSVEREHGGLKRICGLGVSFTRGAASGMMFTYSSLLVTMSRNTITFLRETFFSRYIPFDAAVSMHRYIAWQAVIFTVIHIFGHSFNFYSIATQPASDVGCLFPDYWRQSNELPSFQYWAWQTITGVTGIICTLIVITMYVFASNYSRRWLFRWFWWTHSLGYVLLFIFMILHGSGFLVQRPFFYYFFLGPAVLYTLDKLYSISRNKNEISVVRAELLPSNVTFLEFKKPKTFDYKAGQWVRIACLAQSHNEYHPFTLTSSPHENTLKLHIRAVGPWTKNLRNIYDPDRLRESPYPKLYLDGPFGEGHQDWYKYDVSILVGGGIGVTPFASILKDLVHKTKVNQDIRCKKVFFMWLTRDQKEFEWLTDIIREAENEDTRELLEPHIFITQIPTRYDFRTIMLYVCERNFQRLSGRSLFTGLSSVTHFGRPRFKDFFKALSRAYKGKVEEFGVFSCGPPPMTQSVEDACADMNKFEGAIFSHHFENF